MSAARPRADLRVTQVTWVGQGLAPGDTFSVRATVRNAGRAPAVATTTRFYLSRDRQRNAGDTRLGNGRRIGGLRKRAVRPAEARLTVPLALTPRTYYVLACADDRKQVRETNERNNCRAAKQRMTVRPRLGGVRDPDPPPADALRPVIDVRVPVDGARYERGAVVRADYSCADPPGGSGLAEIAGCAGPVSNGAPLDTATSGDKRFRVSARDRADNTATVEIAYRVLDRTAPTIALNAPADGAVYARGEQVAAAYTCSDDSGGIGLDPVTGCVGTLAVGQFVDTGELGEHTFTVSARDRDGNVSKRSASFTVAPPADIDAPELNRTVAGSIADATRFLYTGDDPVQTGVEPGTIEPVRAAVVRGRALTGAGAPLPLVRVAILDHPEYGSTLTRADGAFDLAVNGGGRLTVSYERDGFLPAQRHVDVPWQDYAGVEDIVMLARDERATEIAADAEVVQVARGSRVTDADGSRQGTLLFPPGTQAEVELPDGGTLALSEMTVRATEYTVGERGLEAMPAALPPASAYTYAVELTVDEAAGRTVHFSQPVPYYVENFLDLTIGQAAPLGYYDRERGVWVAADSGRVVKILSETGGRANLDTDGDGLADNGSVGLDDLGITDAERERLAGLYDPGQSLWRVEIPHFSPWDINWGFGPPPDAEYPEGEADDNQPVDDPCEQQGSIVECENQILGERIGVTGTSFTLNYRSDRVPGRTFGRTLEIPLSGRTLPASVERILLEVHVAGRVIARSFPALTNLSDTFVWDGTDVYGRTIQGRQPVTIRVGYTYRAFMGQTSRFGYSGNGVPAGNTITASRTRMEVVLWHSYRALVSHWDMRAQGLGGWALDVHHAYDPRGHVLMSGDGTRRDVKSLASVIEHYAGGDLFCTGACNGQPAATARLSDIKDLAVADDGTVYLLHHAEINKVTPDGRIYRIAGSGGGCFPDTANCGDGGPALAAAFHGTGAIALGPDSSIHFTANRRVRRIDQNGVITTVVGDGSESLPTGDGGLARKARLGNSAPSIAFGPDGSMYLGDLHRVRRVGTDGIISTVMGTGQSCPNRLDACGDGGQAANARVNPGDLALASDGTLYVVDWYFAAGNLLRRVAPDGTVTTVAGRCEPCPLGTIQNPQPAGEGGPASAANIVGASGVAVAPDGSVYLGTYGRGGFTGVNGRVRKIVPDGTITTIADSVAFTDESAGRAGDGGPATRAWLSSPPALALSPDGALLITDKPCDHTGTGCANHPQRIRRIALPLPSFSDTDLTIASEDGSELYAFDPDGRHMRTVDALTGAELYRFDYDDATNLLAAVIDRDGNRTTIERDAAGNPTAIVAPFGQRTELTLAGGYLSGIANPAGERVTLQYSGGGLLTTLTTPRGHSHRFAYEGRGLLVKDEDPAGGSLTLERTALDEDDPDDPPDVKRRGHRVTIRSALGRTTTYEVEDLPNGSTRRSVTGPTGAHTETIVGPDQSSTTVQPDGTRVTHQFGPDPRFWMQAPVLTRAVQIQPSGLSSVSSTERGVSPSGARDPAAITSFSESTTVNGRVFTRRYDAAARTITDTSAAGRSSVTKLDARGRAIRFEPAPGVDPRTYVYDERGLLTETRQGAERTTLSYDAKGRLVSTTDAAGREHRYGYDVADRVDDLRLPSGNANGFRYDAGGFRTAVLTPGGATHSMAPTPLDQLASYTAPGGDALTQSYDPDRAPTQTRLPGGRAITSAYDTGGRATGSTYPEASVSLDYADTTERVTTATRTPSAAGPAQQTSYAYDGDLLTRSHAEGIANGRFDYRYDSNRFFTGATLTSGPDVVDTALERDADGLLTRIGPFSLTRNGPGGAPTQATDGTFVTSLVYDSLARRAERTHTVAGGPVYAFDLDFDAAGRITRKTETVDATTRTYDYAYDADGQLTEVTRDGEVAERYAYDPNGNRTSRQLGGAPAESAAYDARDRLTRRGDIDYVLNADGFLTERGTDRFTYSARGELLEATVGGRQISYAYDALARRTARTEDGATSQYLYGNPQRPFELSALRSPNGELTTFRYDAGGALLALERGGARYYVATDQLRSPRVVSNAAGQTVKRIEYNAFGVTVSDSNPDFELPISFAGGLHDPATGLIRFGFRDYEPASGRWTATDPILFAGGDVNLFRYVANDPLNRVDPLGLSPCDQDHGETDSGPELGESEVPVGGPDGSDSGSADGRAIEEPETLIIHAFRAGIREINLFQLACTAPGCVILASGGGPVGVGAIVGGIVIAGTANFLYGFLTDLAIEGHRRLLGYTTSVGTNLENHYQP